MNSDDWRKQGHRNKNRGDSFENLCSMRPEKLGLNLIFKRIDRTHRRGVSLSDIECIDFPQLKIDCKFTEGEFTFGEKKQLLKETEGRYGAGSFVIIGEKKSLTRLQFDNVLVLFNSIIGLTMVNYDEWLHYLNLIKLKGDT